MLAFTEMIHIHLIDAYLVNMYKEFLVLKPLRAELEDYYQAAIYLHTLPKSHVPYAKILYTRDDTEILTNKRMTLLAKASTAIMGCYYKTALNYQGFGNVNDEFTNYIKTYVHARMRNTGLTVIESENAEYIFNPFQIAEL